MPRGAHAAPLFAGLVLCLSPARAQPEPLLEQWLETYQASRKVAWERLRVETGPAGGFRVSREAWIPLEAGTLTQADVAQVDSSGLLQRWERAERGPELVAETTLAPAGAELLLVRQAPGRPPERIEAPGPVLDWRVLGLRWARGEAVTGPRHAYLLEVPGLVTRPVALTVRELEGGRGLRLEAPPLRVDYDAQGRIARIDHREEIATVSLPCAPESAQDPARTRPTPRGLGPDGRLPFPLHGLELRPPTPAWRLTRQATGRGSLQLGLEHPTGTRIRVLHLPNLAPTRDRETSQRIAEALVADPPEPRLSLSDPRVATHGEGLAVVFRWREDRRLLPAAEGEAMLIDGREGGLLILATAPAGGAPPHAALAGIRPLPTPRETITLSELGLRFAIPKRWDELEPGDYTSPDRLARFTVERVEVPILHKPSAYQRQLLGDLTRLVADARTDDHPGDLSGRPGRLVTIRGNVRGQATQPLPARIHCAIFVEEQVVTAVTAVAIGTGQSGVELDDTWASVQWRAALLESAEPR